MTKTITKLLIAAAVFFLISCSEKKDSIGNGARTGQTLQVDYVVLTPQPATNKISVTGTLVAAESAMLSAQTPGLVKSIFFKEGQHVSKDQLLVKLDDRQWLARRDKLEAQLKTAEKDLQRKEQLLAIQGISQAEVDDAALQVSSIKADIQELNVMIDYAAIRAPFSGQIGLRSISPGAYISAGAPVARLVQTDPLKLEFDVPERYAGQIRNGQAVHFSLSGSTAVYQATVYATEPVINEATRALRIRARVPNSKQKFIAGAFADIDLVLEKIPDALLLPTESVIPQLNAQVVYRISNGVIQQVPVQLGIRLSRLIQIKSGLSPGDTILVSGLLQAKEGMPVQPANKIAVEKMED